MGIELIHDKDPLALRVLCKGLLDMGLEASVRVKDKVGAITRPVATSKLPSKQQVPCLLYSNSWYSTRPGFIGKVGLARALACMPVFSSVLMTCTPCS